MNFVKRIKYIFPILKDLSLNLSGNLVIIVITQLFIFPLLSHDFTKIEFGSITSLYGINSVIIVLTGDALSNVRLIMHNKNGCDFNFISLLDSVLFSLIVSLVLFFIYGSALSLFDKILFSITTSLMSFLEYGISIYRINLKYNLYLYQNIIIAIGYIIGAFIFKIIHYWSLIFLIGNGVGLIFFLCISGILHEHFNITCKIKYVLRMLTNISIGHVLSSIVSNLDRFTIPIILGMSYLPVFFASNTLSKMFSLIMGPLSDVLLSHLSNSNIRWNIDKLNHLTLIILVIGILLIVPSYFVSNIIMKILYSNIYYGYSNIRIIILLSCIATCLFESWNIINVIYLLCLRSKFQVIINSTFFLSYLTLSIIFSLHYGLIGYTFGYSVSIIISIFISISLSNMNSLWKQYANER